jgi:phosphate-selective porin OprO and OprP
MQFRSLGLGLAAAVALTGAPSWAADPSAEDLRVLVEDLQQEVSILRRKLEVNEEAQAAKGPQPIAGAGSDGFYVRSPDKSFDLRFRAYTHFDARYFTEEDDAFTDTFIFRRVRPIVEGTLGNVVDFRIMPDFANSTLVLQDAYLNLKYFPLANLQAGKFKGPFGLERLQSATAMTFVERALPTQLVPNRDLGMMLHGNWREGLIQYQLALMNGVSDGSSADVDSADGKDVIARVFVHPFQDSTEEWLSGLGLGVAVGYGETESGAPSVYRSQGQATFFQYATGTEFDGNRFRWSPQFYYYWGPFGALGEYVRSSQDYRRNGIEENFDNDAWQIALNYVLTGENASFKGVVPREDFAPGQGKWGAWEVAGRYHELHVDEDVFDTGFSSILTSASDAKAWGVGVNWYLNRWVKLMLDYDRTSFDGGGGADGGDRPAESVVFLRWQLSY